MIDSHAHLTDKRVLPDLDAVVQRAKQAGMTHIINICTDLDSLKKGLALSRSSPWIRTAAATTPHDAHQENPDFRLALKTAAEEETLVAIGETGLDYHYYPETSKIQRKLLEWHIDLAFERNLPLIIHCREAFKDLFDVLKHCSIPTLLHCFTGTLDEAEKALDRGWSLSFSGIITFKNSRSLLEIATKVPLDRLLIETDTPYLAPVPFRGKPCEPSFLIETAKVLAEGRDLSLEALLKATSENALSFFRLNPV